MSGSLYNPSVTNSENLFDAMWFQLINAFTVLQEQKRRSSSPNLISPIYFCHSKKHLNIFPTVLENIN